MQNADATEHWSARLYELAAGAGVPGAALGVWIDGEEILAAHGVLSTATQVRTTVGSLFQIGSITKVWTTTMIMQLVEEERLSLDAAVADVLPSVRLGVEDLGAEVTVRHLLTHTSGLDGDLFTDTGRGDDCVEVYVDRLAKAAQVYPVGAAYSYCNSGFVVLGRIVEVLDDRGWDASLRRRLVEPLGLGETVTLPEEAIFHRTAVGHRERPRESEPVSVWALPRSVAPAGLITASVHDVLAFARLHLDAGRAPDGTRLLDPASVSAMQEPQREIPTIDERGDAIGLAWRLNRWGGRRIIGHDGGTIGQLAYLRIDPDARVGACLLTNSSESGALYQRLFSEVFGEYTGGTVPADPVPAAGVPDLDLQRQVGRYERTSRRLDVSVRDGRLAMVATSTGELSTVDDEPPQEFALYPTDGSGDNFVCRMYDDQPWSTVRFDRFGDGTPYLYTGGRANPRVG